MGLRLILLQRYYPYRAYTSHRGLIPALEPTDYTRAQPGFLSLNIGVKQKSPGNSSNYLIIPAAKELTGYMELKAGLKLGKPTM